LASWLPLTSPASDFLTPPWALKCFYGRSNRPARQIEVDRTFLYLACWPGRPQFSVKRLSWLHRPWDSAEWAHPAILPLFLAYLCWVLMITCGVMLTPSSWCGRSRPNEQSNDAPFPNSMPLRTAFEKNARRHPSRALKPGNAAPNAAPWKRQAGRSSKTAS